MFAAIAGGMLVSAAVGAGPVGYLQATGYFKKDSRPTLYQPLNLLDARPQTAWCSTSSDVLNDHLTLGFKEPTRLDELRITNGNDFDEATWNSFGRARKLELSGGDRKVTFELEDKRGVQTVSISPPVTGIRFRLDVLDQHPAEDPEAAVCMTDLLAVADGKPLSGAWLGQKLKFDKAQALVLGVWYTGYAGKPDKFLAFFIDGSFRYSYEPYDTKLNTPKALDGTYEAGAGRVTFEVGGKKVTAKLNLTPGKGDAVGLSLEGDVPPELKQAFRNNP
jgi:hypothetical protein